MPVSWQLWAPPLDPPVSGGLPMALAEEIAAAYWRRNPWLAAALMWEHYAAMQPPEPQVVSVSTGVQSVAYSAPGSRFALAMARAQWFRDQMGSLFSVPLEVAPLDAEPWPVDWWQRNYDDPAAWERAR